MSSLQAGSACIDITPKDSQFLFGYPHVKRYSTGVKNPLYSSSLYIENAGERILFIANDIIFVDKELCGRVRSRISEATGMDAGSIMVSATHTHSGPITVNYLSNVNDPIVPKADPGYLELLEAGIVKAGIEAVQSSRPARAGMVVADAKGVGTNRRDPSGPADPQVPVLVVKEAASDDFIACMLVYSMHPTVLHEDSTLISGDFPSFTREFLQKTLLGKGCPVLYHTGPEGNQSPRHVTRSNTFAEAERLGKMLGERALSVIEKIDYTSEVDLGWNRVFISPPVKKMPSLQSAESNLEKAVRELNLLKDTGASAQNVRTAECDWFGAEETVTLSKAAESGELVKYAETCLPAEVQVFRIGDWFFAGWPGEVFVEYSLEIKTRYKNLFVINLANGEFQGYIVTPEAEAEGGYEASNALFGSDTGSMLIDATSGILERWGK